MRRDGTAKHPDFRITIMRTNNVRLIQISYAPSLKCAEIHLEEELRAPRGGSIKEVER